jgi:flagellar hook assembly protein FlgD
MTQNPQNVLVLSSLPSFPDDKGNVVITNLQGSVVDEVSYSEKWHFGLISDDEGVALERIDPNDSSQKQSNWHSAASTVGYGTPTYKNSQFKQTSAVNATVEVNQKVFSPDNDGQDDIAAIGYQVTESGYIANITIFEANGRLVRYLVKNALLGLKGSWNWDGLNENGQKLPVGTYIVYTEIFSLQGKKKQFKNTVVLARRLN